MRLWTIRNPKEVSILQKNGVLTTDKTYIEQDFISAYNWMSMKLNSIDKKPSHCNYPIWAWKCYDKSRFCKPDLRLRWGTKAKEELYLIELEIPDKKVLLSEYHLWHSVLDNNYIAYSEDDELLCKLDKSWHGESLGDSIQAVFWELKLEWVTKITFFKSK